MKNDWLRTFPLDATIPDSWGMNGLCLDKLDEMEALWRSHGYMLKFGSETEFELQNLAGAQEMLKTYDGLDHRAGNSSDYALTRQAIAVIEAALPAQDIYPRTVTELYDYLDHNPDAAVLAEETQSSIAEMREQIAKFSAGLRSEDEEIRKTSKTNIFLARIHTLPFAEGGLRDLIAPRFGEHAYGLGWNDCGTTAEVRTPILNGHRALIETYHKIIYTLYTEAPKFGLVPDQRLATPPQPHISIWRIADNTNMMVAKDDAIADFQERAMRGYYAALKAMPFMAHDVDVRGGAMEFVFDCGTMRDNYVRQERDNWEIRRGQDGIVTHLARHLLPIMTGMAYGCLICPDLQTLQSGQPEMEMRRSRHPVMKHLYGDPISALCSTIEHCTVKDDNTLRPSLSALTRNLDGLLREIGPDNADKFRAVDGDKPDEIYDLTTLQAWLLLIGMTTITENGLGNKIFDEEPELAAAFDMLRFQGLRTAMEHGGIKLDSTLHELRRAAEAITEQPFVRSMFLPYEAAAIRHHYLHRVNGLMQMQVRHIIDAFENSVVANDIQAPVACARNTLFVDQFFDELMALRSQSITTDFDLQMTLHTALSERQGGMVRRATYMNKPLYLNDLRPLFARAVAARPKNASLLQNGMLDLLAQRMRQPIFDLGDKILEILDSSARYGTAAHFREMNLPPTEAMEGYVLGTQIKAAQMLLLALCDNQLSTQDLRRMVHDLHDSMPEVIEELDKRYLAERTDHLSLAIYKGLKTRMPAMVRDMAFWIDQRVVDDHLLPAPIKRNGP